jgi:hypothetical protein
MNIVKLPVVKLQLIFKAKKLEDENLLSEYGKISCRVNFLK